MFAATRRATAAAVDGRAPALLAVVVGKLFLIDLGALSGSAARRRVPRRRHPAARDRLPVAAAAGGEPSTPDAGDRSGEIGVDLIVDQAGARSPDRGDERRQHDAGGPAQHVVGVRRKRRGLRIDLDHDGAVPLGGVGQRRRGIDFGGVPTTSSTSQRLAASSACASAAGGSISSNQTTSGRRNAPHARAARRLAGAGLVPAIDDAAAARAFHAPDVAVQLDDVRAARRLVQAVDVLRDQQEFRNAPLDRGQRVVPGIGRGFADALAPPRIPVPDELRIARERGRASRARAGRTSPTVPSARRERSARRIPPKRRRR